MDENAVRQLLKLLETANGLQEQSPSLHGSQYSQLATLTPQPDRFFGPIGEMVARAIPGMTVRGIDGNPTPVLRTNFNLHNTGMSGFMNGIMTQNSAVHGAAMRTQQDYSNSAYASLFGEGSALQRMIDAKGKDGKYVIKDGKERDKYHAITSFLGSPMMAGIGNQFIDKMLGYDRGVSSNMMNAASFSMAAGHNIGNAFSYNEMGGLDRHLTDPFTRDFQDTRAALASLGTAGVQSVMYDGKLKKSNMHGASETLVSDIMANAIASGKLDEMTGGDFSKMVEDKKELDRRMDSTSARKEEAQEKLKEARKREDKSAVKDLEEQIKGFDQELSSLGEEAKALGDAVGKAAEPLVEAVTGVVSSMKDFYGSEEEAKRALDALTGGKGSSDPAVAEQVHKQMDEIKMLSMSAGIDPSIMGKHLENVSDAFSASSGRGSRLANGSGYNGQMALELTRMFASQMGAAAGDPARQAQLLDAQRGYAAAAGQSRGNDFVTMLMAARKSGKFEGREDDYDRLVELANTGRVEDFNDAFRQLYEIGWGSEEAGREFQNNRALMAMTRADFSPEEDTEAASMFGNMHRAEVARMGVESSYGAANKKQYQALRAAGLDMQAVENNVGSADFDTIMDSLSEISDDEGAEVAMDAMQRDYENELRRNGGDEAAAKKAVAQKYHKEYASFLSTENRDKVKSDSSNAISDAYMSENYFKDENGEDITLDAEDFLKDIGAAGEDGRLTKTALSQAANNLMKYASSHELTTANGETLDASETQRRLNDINKMIAEGRGEEAQDLLSEWYGNLDESSQRQLSFANGKGKKTYRTADVLDKEAEEKTYLDELAENADLAAKMNGMTDDQKLTYARYHKELTAEIDPEEKEKIMANMKKMEEEAAEKSRGAGEKAVEAIQTGDISKFMEIFKNGNATMEQFFDFIKKMIGLAGGIVVSDEESLNASKLASAKSGEGRARFLQMSSITMGQRLGMGDDDTIKSYLEALRGGDVSDKDVAAYKKSLEATKNKGDRSKYKDALGIEDKLLGESESELKNKVDKESDPTKKAELQAQLDSVKKQRETLSAHKDKISDQKASEFQDEAMKFKEAQANGKDGKGASGKVGGVSDQAIMSLVSKIDLLVSTLRTKHADPTQD